MEMFKTKGTCSTTIEFEVEDNKLTYCKYINGCDGNLKGIAKLVTGQDIDWVIERLEGVQCKTKGTSCPDQLAKALKEYKEKQAQA